MGITKRELVLISDTHAGNYVIWIKATAEGFWKAEIHLKDQDRIYDIETTRGLTKSWRNLSDVILFVQENCRDFLGVFIEVGIWVLTILEKEDGSKKQGEDLRR